MPLAFRSLLSNILIAFLLIGLTTAFAAAPIPSIPSQAANPQKLVQTYGKLPLSFEANRGQADPGIQFLSRGSGYSLYLTRTAALLALSKSSPGSTGLVRMSLSGANTNVQAAGADPLPGVSNYFLGNDPAKWHSGIPTYAKVQYTAVYPGIDLVYYGNQSQLEYDFVVAPGADPNCIRLDFSGQNRLKIAANGDLILQGNIGQAKLQKPVVYQEKDGVRQPVPGSFGRWSSTLFSPTPRTSAEPAETLPMPSPLTPKAKRTSRETPLPSTFQSPPALTTRATKPPGPRAAAPSSSLNSTLPVSRCSTPPI
jgi:hypothetical protein